MGGPEGPKDGTTISAADLVGFLKPTTPDLSARIGSFEKVWGPPSKRIVCRAHYVKFRDGKPSVDDLIKIAHARIVNFVLPRPRIEEVLSQFAGDPLAGDAWMLLATEARDLFIKTKEETGRSGELGELLLYMLLEWVLEAPIVACKMYLKTSKQMPVHGMDGIHVGHEGGKLIIYWGESKLHSGATSAVNDIIESVKKQLGSPVKREAEVRVIHANLNIDGLSTAAKAALKDYLNPYKPQSNQLVERHACLAGFDTKLYDDVASEPPETCEAKFREKLETRVQEVFDHIIEKTTQADLGSVSFSYFLLPFPSVDIARARFQEKLWGPE